MSYHVRNLEATKLGFSSQESIAIPEKNRFILKFSIIFDDGIEHHILEYFRMDI